jgi:hypothetical protein
MEWGVDFCVHGTTPTGYAHQLYFLTADCAGIPAKTATELKALIYSDKFAAIQDQLFDPFATMHALATNLGLTLPYNYSIANKVHSQAFVAGYGYDPKTSYCYGVGEKFAPPAFIPQIYLASATPTPSITPSVAASTTPSMAASITPSVVASTTPSMAASTTPSEVAAKENDISFVKVVDKLLEAKSQNKADVWMFSASIYIPDYTTGFACGTNCDAQVGAAAAYAKANPTNPIAAIQSLATTTCGQTYMVNSTETSGLPTLVAQLLGGMMMTLSEPRVCGVCDVGTTTIPLAARDVFAYVASKVNVNILSRMVICDTTQISAAWVWADPDADYPAPEDCGETSSSSAMSLASSLLFVVGLLVFRQ